MKKRNINLISAGILILFLGAVIYFVLGVVLDRKNGPQKATDRFNTLASSVQEISDYSLPESYDFSARFISALGDIRDFKNLMLIYNGKTLYSYPPAQQKFTVADSMNFETTLMPKTGGTLVIKAEIYTNSVYSIFDYGRIAFLVIMTGTLLAVFVLVFSRVNNDKKDEQVPTLPENEDSNDDGFEEFDSASIFEDDDFDLKKELFKDEKNTENPPEQKFYEQETDGQENEEKSYSEQTEYFSDEIEDIPEEKLYGEDENKEIYNEKSSFVETENNSVEEETFAATEDTIENEAEPFSDTANEEVPAEDKTTIGKAIRSSAGIMEDLEKALVDASAADSDISIFVIKTDSAEKITADSIYSILGETKSTVYRTSDGGLFIITEEMVLDDALLLAEDIHVGLSNLLQSEENTPKVTIGISSRTQRMISAGRLLTEAEEAQKHADDDPDSPIIAFKVNPDKYRKYILEN